MQQEKKTGRKKLSFHLFISYFVIMIVPSITIIIVYYMASNALFDVQKEKAYRLLSENVSVFEQQMEEIKNVATYISADSELKAVIEEKAPSKTEEFYRLYKMAARFPRYEQTNRMIEKVQIFMEDKQYMLELPSVVPINANGFATVKQYGFSSYEEMFDASCDSFHYGEVLRFCADDRVYNSPYVVMRSLPSTKEVGKCAGTIVISLKEAQIRQMLRGALIDEESSVFVVSREGEVIRCVGKAAETPQEFEGLSWNGYKKQKNFAKNSILHEKTVEGGVNWKIISVTPKASISALIGNIRYLCKAFCTLAILIGFFICLSYWYRRRTVVERYYNCSTGMNGEEEPQNYRFWNSLSGFLDQVEDLQTTASAQKEMAHKEAIRRLLYGAYTNEEELQKDIGGLDPELLAQTSYYVAVFNFEDQRKEEISLSNREFAFELKKHFDECISEVHRLYELNNFSFAVILATDQPIFDEEIKKKVERFNYYFYKERALTIFTGISHEVKTLMQIAPAYEEAGNVSAYAQCFGIRVVLTSEDLPHEEPEPQQEHTELTQKRTYFQKNVEEHYADPAFNLAALADLTGIAQRKLYKEFVDCFGVTFSDYLEQLRIRMACEKLKEGSAVKDVAAACGYSSDYSFRRAFKRVIGMAPSDFQKSTKQEV